jgi:hypothetical protein
MSQRTDRIADAILRAARPEALRRSLPALARTAAILVIESTALLVLAGFCLVLNESFSFGLTVAGLLMATFGCVGCALIASIAAVICVGTTDERAQGTKF